MAFWNRDKGDGRSRALLGSARRLDVVDRRGESGAQSYKSWQDEAWWMWDNVGEFRQGVTWLSNVLSRARLVAAVAADSPGDEPEPIDPETDDPAVRLVEEIGHGIGGQSELLRSAAVHLSVAGEGWFVGQVDGEVEGVEDAGELSWKFYSRDEVRKTRDGSGRVEIRVSESRWVPLPPESLPVRMWRPHDRFHWEAASSAKAALPILRRLELLNRKVDAQIQSRLWSAGMYWVPEEMDFPAKEGYEDADDPFIAEIIDLGSLAMKTPGSASAALPLFLRAKGDLIDQLRWDTFGDTLDPELREDREFEIRRLATAMDVPPEVLLGMAGINHWGQWQIEEAALKSTIAQLLELVCWSLTTGYLRPALSAMSDDEFSDEVVPAGAQRIVWYDITELEVRPDRSQDSFALWSNLAISDAAVMRETGLNESDLLRDPAELRRRLGLRLAANPSTAQIGMELLGISTVAEPLLPGQSANDEVRVEEEEPSANPGDLPANDTPQAPPDTNGEAPPSQQPSVLPGR